MLSTLDAVALMGCALQAMQAPNESSCFAAPSPIAPHPSTVTFTSELSGTSLLLSHIFCSCALWKSSKRLWLLMTAHVTQVAIRCDMTGSTWMHGSNLLSSAACTTSCVPSVCSRLQVALPTALSLVLAGFTPWRIHHTSHSLPFNKH
jgi:hypothetical protein